MINNDTISRQAVHRQINKWVASGESDKSLLSLHNRVDNLLSVSTEKTGRWIDDGCYAEGHSDHAYRCSECGEHYIGYVGEFNYCPNCGAKMEVEE